MTAAHDRKVASLKPEPRRKLLDAIAHRHPIVCVEHSVHREFDRARRTVGRVIGVAYATSGSAEVLVVEPLDPGLRLVAISGAHVLRVTAATPTPLPAQLDEPARPYAYRLGEVLAGPPR